MSAAEQLARDYLSDHPAEAARLLERADPRDAADVLAELSPAVGAAVYRALAPSPAAALGAALSDEALAGIVAGLPVDAGGAALRHLDAGRRPRVLALLESGLGARVAAALAYPDGTAGALADPLVLALAEDATVADARRQLASSERHVFYYLYVVDGDRRLVGALALPELMEASARRTLADIMRRDLVRLDARTDLAAVAAHPAWRDLDALPVVDDDGRLIGAIRHQVIRQTSLPPEHPVMGTLVGLSELYWAGLSGMLATLGHTPTIAGGEGSDVA